MAWIVHKFGGTSLADADCFRRVAAIVSAPCDANLAVVVSAMGGVTDQLLGLISQAAAGESVTDTVDALRARYAAVTAELLPAGLAGPLLKQFEQDLHNIQHVLKALSLVRSASHRSRDLVSGFGELWSARLMTGVLKSGQAGRSVKFVNARDVLITGRGEMGPVIDWEASRSRRARVIPSDFTGIAVVTGYIASSRDGLPTTLGRNGSDYSASIFAALLGAGEINIWTDVDGVMSGDPRQVPEATVINEISYSEAMELAYFGAKVLHPRTMGASGCGRDSDSDSQYLRFQPSRDHDLIGVNDARRGRQGC